MTDDLLTTEEFYVRVAAYMQRVDPHWAEDRWRAQMAHEQQLLRDVLGEGQGRRVLDCACGDGAQVIPLATMGWQVTATDVTEPSLEITRRRARQHGVAIDSQVCDMRQLGERFPAAFDWVISCMALDNLTSDDDIQQAVAAMQAVLKPGGRCYIRLRDLEHLVAVRPRYDFREERPVPGGRVIRLEDWDYARAPELVNVWVFLHEDSRKTGYRWETSIFRYRRRVLGKRELARYLHRAGFEHVAFLPQPSPWAPYEVVATTAGAS